MLGAFSQKLAQSGQTAGVIISVALMLFLGFAMTRITKALRLPDVTAYILTGILIGPYCLNLIPASVISGMDFISDIALAFIAFSVGEFFKLSTLKKSGFGVIVITLLEACMASVLVFALTYFILGLDLAFCAVLAGFLLFGGAKRIGAAAELLVPIAAGCYILLCIGVLLVFRRRIPAAFGQILAGAFCPRAVTGGILGSAFQALSVGCRRGVFTNEAGMGTASIAHACAEAEPAEQGLMGMVEVFLDTIVICTLTALVILVSGVPIPYGVDVGGELTTAAFSQVYGAGASLFLAGALSLFAIATILGWGLYGSRCAQFLFGGWKGFAAAQTAMVVLGAVLDTQVVWQLSETANGLMAIPNLICLAALTGELRRITKDYKKSGASGSSRCRGARTQESRQ